MRKERKSYYKKETKALWSSNWNIVLGTLKLLIFILKLFLNKYIIFTPVMLHHEGHPVSAKSKHVQLPAAAATAAEMSF